MGEHTLWEARVEAEVKEDDDEIAAAIERLITYFQASGHYVGTALAKDAKAKFEAEKARMPVQVELYLPSQKSLH